MKQMFVPKQFRAATLAMIEQANDIIEDYMRMGYELTLRQLYYQFVARDLLPNSDKSYNKLGETISNARLAGMVDWDAIRDRTRFTRALTHWDGPGQIVEAAANSYRRDHWEGQTYYAEAWVEKDALIDVIQRASEGADITCFSCRGYVSQTAMYEAARRFKYQIREDRKCVLFHLGDHDPSGIDMTRDIQDRLSTFGADVEVRRLALNMDQVQQYGPPPNPAKLTDSRCGDYIAEYGYESWELDALEPPVLVQLIRDEVATIKDQPAWDAVLEREAEEKEALREAADDMHERF